MAPIGVFLQDARYAVRTLVKMPGFTATCVICLGLGIGVNSTMFSVVDTVAIRPLPFADPDRLVELHTTNIANGTDRGSASYLELQDWKERTHSFASVVAFTSRGLAISDGREPERFIGALITWDLFPTLGIQPILGRQFRPEEDQPGAPPVVLLSHGLWERRYAADPDVIGRSVTVNGQVHTVVGVMPPRFQFPELAQLWLPLVPTEHSATRADRTLDVIARLKSGVGLVAARQDLKSVADQLAKEHTENVGRGGAVETFYDALMPSDIRLIVFTMMGAVTLVLLIACANVANLLLARATSRQREIAVRAALGAGRRRIVGQLLTESAMLGLVSVPLGALIAFIGLRWLTSSIPPQNQAPYYIDWSMNPRVILYTAAIALVTSVIFGLAPAIQAVKANLQDSLRDGRSSGGGRNRLRSALVSVEIALALILLVGASLFVRSFLNLERARAGLDASGLLVLRFYMVNDGYQAPDAQVRLAEGVVRRVESIPGVEAVMASNMVPYIGGGTNGPAIPEGISIAQGKEPNVLSFGVTRHWLRALNVPLVAGRDFTETEGSTRSSVAIVNQVFAQRLWPTSPDPVGKRFRFTRDPQTDWITVVGVVNDFRLFTVRDGKPSPYAFVSYPRDPSRTTGLTIRLAASAHASLMSEVRQEIHKSDPTLPIFNAQSGEEARADTYWEYRLFGWMFSIFGAIALALASIGVYGVLSYTVSQRAQEIGVRMALGASRRDVFSLILRHATQLAAAGILFGVVGAVGVTRVVRSQLYNVSPTDALSFIATALFLAFVALVASFLPARRATGVDPMMTLRAE